MRFELTFHTYIEVFNRLLSLRFDPKDWEFRVSKTASTKLIFLGPIHLGYTNQKILNQRIQEMIANYEQDFADYQVKDKTETITAFNASQNILH